MYHSINLFLKELLHGEEARNELAAKCRDLKLIKKYKIPYVIVDRKSNMVLENCNLLNYDERIHELLVDSKSYMKYIMR